MKHCTILGRGYILLTAKVLYDLAVFNSSRIHALSSKYVQAFFEEPEVCTIAIPSSSIIDQAALIADCKSCVQHMSPNCLLRMGYKSQINKCSFMGTSQQPSLSEEPKQWDTTHAERVVHTLHDLMTFHTRPSANRDP